MSLTITQRARLYSKSNNIINNLVLDIEGVTDKYGTLTILKYIRIGDDDLFIGDDWVIGGSSALEDQVTAISLDGTSTTISQKLDIDKSSGTTVSQLSIALVDIDEAITRLITPGEVVPDVLGRKATVWLGFQQTSFPEDYIRIFRGTIDDIKADSGKITFQLSHPDQKKRQGIFIRAETTLDGAIGAGDTTIDITDAGDFFFPITGPNGMEDTSIQYGARIDDEILFYTGITGNQLTGVTRGALGTTAASHDNLADVASFIRLTGNAIDLALKIYLSGWNGPYEEDVDVTNFNILGDLTSNPNSIFFSGVNVEDVYGVVPGDYITTTGAANASNNVTLKQLDQVVKTDEGSYIVVNDVTFVDEADSLAIVDFRSQYDTLHPGCGLRLHNNEVDIVEHEKLKRWFLSSFEYDFYIRDSIANAKEFVEGQIYFPAAAYSLPRKSRTSVGYHIGPLPNLDIKTANLNNTISASKLALRRSITKNFYNTIVYKFEEDALEADKFLRGVITINQDSKDRIPVGTKALVISSHGLREVLSGQSLATSASNRRIRRYKFSAEYIEGFQVTYGDSFNVEIGDILVVDFAALKLADTKNATRAGEPRLFEVYDKTFDIRTGGVKLSLLDTAYSTATRYCLMSPSSKLLSGSTSTVLKLTPTGNSVFGSNEGGKWSRYIGATIRVKNTDYSNSSTSTIQSVLGNTITLVTALSFTPAADDTLIIANYDEMPDDDVSKKLKLIYGFMRDSNFADGSMQYMMI